jgi:hypothetical protein
MRYAFTFMFVFTFLLGCAVKHDEGWSKVETSKDEKILEAPIAAINLSKCDGSIALYVIVDATHTVRFDQQQTTVFTLDHGQVTEVSGPPTPYKNALELAQSAGITSHANVPCDGVST